MPFATLTVDDHIATLTLDAPTAGVGRAEMDSLRDACARIEGSAERIEYDSKAEKLQMFNRAHLTKGNDDVRGNYISYDSATEFFRVTGGGKQAASPGNPEGRVRAIIQPRGGDKPAATAPAVPLKPAADMINPRENIPGSAR